MIFRAGELTVYALDGRVEIVCLPGGGISGPMASRSEESSKIILNKKEARGLIVNLKDAIRILSEDAY
jgi:hypothetical protein